MSTFIEEPETTILVPYVPGKLHPETKNWANGYANTVFAELNPADDTAYFQLMAEYWQRPGELIVVEQDMVPTEHHVMGFIRCDRALWCTAPYPIQHGTVIDYGLGCVRFSASLRKRWPGVMVRVGYIDDDGADIKTWRRLDERISRVLHQLGYKPHHHGRAQHLHDYSKG